MELFNCHAVSCPVPSRPWGVVLWRVVNGVLVVVNWLWKVDHDELAVANWPL